MAGRDRGEDNRNGDVGVPKLDGRDNLDSEERKVFGTEKMSGLSEVSGVQRTVGKDTLRDPFLVRCASCSSDGGSAMFICNEQKTFYVTYVFA